MIRPILAALAAALIALPAVAQTDGLTTGEVVDEAPQVGQTYTAETHGDWDLRCVKTEEGDDPCQLYQLLLNEEGGSVMEISIFTVPDGQQVEAGATIITPLETLLTQQLTMVIDADPAKRYPFSFCTQSGCIARIGLTGDDLAAMRRGIEGRLRIVPAAAPDRNVIVGLSLNGFTAGFNALRASAGQ
ncbi:MAG: invasion associated locus B family protein [Rhodobacteraceae bacterium]|nr:invasion associated locus B family protein [Alphaproteobacteria bacterium]MBT8474078.1 invasion associated locus B family protein [Alphaproteobacteria bacterium]NNK68443.1 invasion associated locus B family protein [Paracoccaceae bacterium]